MHRAAANLHRRKLRGIFRRDRSAEAPGFEVISAIQNEIAPAAEAGNVADETIDRAAPVVEVNHAAQKAFLAGGPATLGGATFDLDSYRIHVKAGKLTAA